MKLSTTEQYYESLKKSYYGTMLDLGYSKDDVNLLWDGFILLQAFNPRWLHQPKWVA